MESYAARKESRVVMVPVPAIRGKATGTIDAVSGISSLYSFIPSIISTAKKKITIDPAMAKDFISTPKNLRMVSPRNRNPIMMKSDTIVACSAFMIPTLVLICSKAGIEPITSMTAKRIVVTVRMSCQFIVVVLSR